MESVRTVMGSAVWPEDFPPRLEAQPAPRRPVNRATEAARENHRVTAQSCRLGRNSGFIRLSCSFLLPKGSHWMRAPDACDRVCLVNAIIRRRAAQGSNDICPFVEPHCRQRHAGKLGDATDFQGLVVVQTMHP